MPTLSSPSIPARLARLRAALPTTGADAILISHPENRAYLSGFTGSAGHLLITADRAVIATDFRYYDQVALEAPHFELAQIKTNLHDLLPALLEGVSQLAFEADHAAWSTVEKWKEAAPAVEWVPTKAVTHNLRASKDEAEIATLRRAILLADAGLAHGLSEARPGMTEVELAWIIESYMRTHGAQGVAFDLHVASGPNGARPHAHTSDKELLRGEPIVIDMGAEVDGYRSDLTRTVSLGEPADADKFWSVYNTVLGAQTAAIAAIRPGLSGKEADGVAREFITQAGFGEAFGHGLGHGVGLEIHEEPFMGRLSTSILQQNMVVTVEPGIYLPGWGGVRIEDIVLVTANGCEVLTTSPKYPII
jgi:Xaa-Pro aminopeptidase